MIASALIGPFRYDGTSGKTNTSYRSPQDNLSGSRGRYYENNVAHSKIEGTFDYVPAIVDITPTPNVYEPEKVSWKCINMSNLSTVSLNVPFGLLTNGKAFFYPDSVTLLNYNRAWIKTGPLSFEEYIVKAHRSSVTALATVIKNSYAFKSSDKTNTVFTRLTSGELTTTELASKHRDPETFGDIVAFVNKFCTAPLGSPRDVASGGTYKTFSPLSLSITSSQGMIDSLSRTLLEDINFPLPEKHFGDLAMEASQKVNANPVNMIAFLRDLRNPKEMIPKLRNLSKLKDHAGNYLALNYGILPTISDIKAIIEAFKRIGPYIDKNGFKTYNAVSQDFDDKGVLTYNLEQRIKIAIENEDSGFQALAQKVESAGFALTLENVWDLIPYSFVLDWFIDIGGFLERADTRMRLMRLNIRYATMSSKKTTSMRVNPSAQFPMSGTLSVVRYQRWTTDHCPEPPLIPSSTPTFSNHWLEGSALILQRAK